MKVLVTGAAGFIGFHVVGRLLARGDVVVGLDNLNAYYDVSLKQARLKLIDGHSNFSFVKQDLENRSGIEAIFAEHRFDRVVHLATVPPVVAPLGQPQPAGSGPHLRH